MKILFYQVSIMTVRFIYQTVEGFHKVVLLDKCSVNREFVEDSGAEYVKDGNIHDLCGVLNKMYSIEPK